MASTVHISGRLVQRHLHDLKFLEKGGVTVPHGTLFSYNDNDRKIARDITIQGLVKFDQFGALDLGTLQRVLLGAPAEKDVKRVNRKLFEYLAGNAHRCAKVFLDSSGTVGLMQAFSKDDAARTGCPVGYRVYVLDKAGGPPAKLHKPNDTAFSSYPSFSSSSSSSNDSSSAAQSAPRRGQEQLAAMDHYNENLKRDRTARHQSQIFHMRNLNNCVKSCVLRDAVASQPERPVRVIDFGCGMGGDMGKWVKTCPHGLARYVGIDIAAASLRSFASTRLDSFRGDTCRVITHLICADVSSESLTDPDTQLETHTWVPAGDAGGRAKGRTVTSHWALTASPLSAADLFDVASCQFAVHYMFQTRAKADFFFAQVGRHLRQGGMFVATTIDCRVIREMIAKQECGAYEDGLGSGLGLGCGAYEDGAAAGVKEGEGNGGGAVRQLMVKNGLGNKLLTISFAREHWDRMLGGVGEVGSRHATTEHVAAPQDDDDHAYGVQYEFSLFDSADASQAAVNAPEWLVPLGGPLDRLAARHGLCVQSVENFHQYVSRREGDRGPGGLGQLMDELSVFNYQGTVGAAEWAIARCYCVLVFSKSSQGSEDVSLASDLRAYEEFSTTFRSSATSRGRDTGATAPSRHATQNGEEPNSKSGGFVPFVAFKPPSPDSPPPGGASFEPTSPDSPPPTTGFAPSSPEGPPPSFEPTSPDNPPPTSVFAPSSPEGSPPDDVLHAPLSPEGPPPRELHEPQSPEGPPPPDMPEAEAGGAEDEGAEPMDGIKNEDDDEDDPFLLFLIRTRARAVQRAGGNRRWDKLSDAARDELMEACRLALAAEGHMPEGM